MKKTPAASAKKAPARKRTAAATPARKTGGAEALLRAGLKALGDARDDVVKRQTHVIESLLGARAMEEIKARAFPGLDTLVGFRKFEDVFDKRVATALERLGVPSAAEVEALREEVRQLREALVPGGGGAAGKSTRRARR